MKPLDSITLHLSRFPIAIQIFLEQAVLRINLQGLGFHLRCKLEFAIGRKRCGERINEVRLFPAGELNRAECVLKGGAGIAIPGIIRGCQEPGQIVVSD